MSVAVLDVNVLVALFDPAHMNHEDAPRWLSRNRQYGWATCPITINGCIRVLSSPAYPTVDATPAEIARRLKIFTSSGEHHFWEDSVSLLDSSLFHLPAIRGPQKITDAYLLGLAVKNHGRLATFDRGIPSDAIAGAGHRHLALIESK